MTTALEAAQAIVDRCAWIAGRSDEPGRTTRTFLSPAARAVHDHLGAWMTQLGMAVRVDAAGNLRGTIGTGPRVIIGSHLDTVPDAGAYDGVLGVVLGITLASLTRGRVPFTIEVIGFSDEEGVRFGTPFIGSRALVGTAAPLLDVTDAAGTSVRQALEAYGLDPTRLGEAIVGNAAGYLEFHIEQGPVLEQLAAPLAVVDAIAGQSRLDVTFAGHTNHAGTTPMTLRHDALAAAAEWIVLVEQTALATGGLQATVGHVSASPNVHNAINGRVIATLDVRHVEDDQRREAVARLRDGARAIAARRGVTVTDQVHLDQAAVPMDPTLTTMLTDALAAAGHPVHQLTSGAGHDAMIVAPHIPSAMLFLRSPGGISHHPAERVLVEDVAAALEVGRHFLERWEPADA